MRPFSLKDLVLGTGSNPTCNFCGSQTWGEESINCCKNGQSVVPRWELPRWIEEEFYSNSSVSTNCRYYNGLFSFGALGSKRAVESAPMFPSTSSGVCCIKLSGRPYIRLFNPHATYEARFKVSNGSRSYIVERNLSEEIGQMEVQRRRVNLQLAELFYEFLCSVNSWISKYRNILFERERRLREIGIEEGQGPLQDMHVVQCAENRECISMMIYEGSSTLYNPSDRNSLACFKIGDEANPMPTFISNHSSAAEPLLFQIQRIKCTNR